MKLKINMKNEFDNNENDNSEVDIESLIVTDSPQPEKVEEGPELEDIMAGLEEIRNRVKQKEEVKVIDLEVDKKDKKLLGIKEKRNINYGKIIRLSLLVIFLIVLINPFKIDFISSKKEQLKNKILDTRSQVSERIRIAALISNDDIKTVVEKDDFKQYNFYQGSENETILEIDIPDIDKSYFLVVESNNIKNEAESIFKDFAAKKIEPEESSNLNIKYYNNNIIYNYTSDYLKCVTIKMTDFEQTGKHKIYLNINYNDFKEKYQDNQDTKITIRKEY